MSAEGRSHPGRVFDGHCDLLSELRYAGGAWFETGRRDGHIDLPRLRRSELSGGLFAIFARDPDWAPDWWRPILTADGGYRIPDQPAIAQATAYREAAAQLDIAHGLLGDHSGDLMLIATRADLHAAQTDPRVGVVLHLEGADPIDAGLAELDSFHEAGVRSVGLVWSRPNRFAHGVPFRFPASPDIGPGLTRDGARLVRRCNELGVLIDLAHLNERGFWDVAALSCAPLVVSHAAAQALCPSSRNLTDAQLECVGASGGIVGMNFNVRDVRADGREDPDTPLDAIAEHIEYIAQRIGIDHVGLGSDLDGATMPAAIGDVTGFAALLACIQRHGFDDASLDKVARGNWLRVLDQTLPATGEDAT